MKYASSYRKGIWMLLMLLLVGKITAQQVTQKEAVKAAIGSLVKKYPEKASSFSETSVYTVFSLTDKGNCLVYEVCFKNGNRVILSGNKSCLPVLGYMDFCTVDSTQMESVLSFGEDIPDGLKLLLDNYAEQNRYCFDNNIEDENINMQWDILQQEKRDKSTTVVIIPPLLATKWGQSRSNDTTSSYIDYYAYNFFAPEGTNCPLHCYAGCGAVAMAQIIKYWNEPNDIPYRCSQYDWYNMPNALIREGNSYNDYIIQKDAVAKLIYECGIESQMQYCSSSNDDCGSTSTISATMIGFHNYGYTHASVISRVSNDNDWMSKLYHELFDNQPIYYIGYETASWVNGHAFVCDGYYKDENDNQFFHFNWGWRGRYDGFYTISNLSPGNYTFNYYHKIIGGIYPSNCWQNIVMECDKTFSNGTVKSYVTAGEFKNNYHNYVINNGANVLLQAGDEIYLTDGFYAAAGSEFIAYLAPCGNLVSLDDEETRDEDINEISMVNLRQDMERTNQTLFSVSPMDMSIYPNPVTGTFNIRLGNPSEKVRKVEVFNPQGVLTSSNNNPDENTVDANGLPAGMYLVRVTGNMGNVYFGKFVKE